MVTGGCGGKLCEVTPGAKAFSFLVQVVLVYSPKKYLSQDINTIGENLSIYRRSRGTFDSRVVQQELIIS